MYKTEFIKEVASSTGVDEATTRKVFNGIQETMQSKLIEGIDLKLESFMNLTLEITNARTRHNIQTNKLVRVPARYRVKVTLPRFFKERIAKKTVYGGTENI